MAISCLAHFIYEYIIKWRLVKVREQEIVRNKAQLKIYKYNSKFDRIHKLKVSRKGQRISCIFQIETVN